MSGGGDAKCKLFRFDKKSLEEVRTFEMDFNCRLWAAGFSPDEQYIACSGDCCQNAKYDIFPKLSNKCLASPVFSGKKAFSIYFPPRPRKTVERKPGHLFDNFG